MGGVVEAHRSSPCGREDMARTHGPIKKLMTEKRRNTQVELEKERERKRENSPQNSILFFRTNGCRQRREKRRRRI